MLLKVKPDGPVYEVLFTSQLLSVPRNTRPVDTSQLQTVPASEIISDATVTSDSGITCPVVSNVPPVNTRRGETTIGKVLSDTGHMHQSNTASTQQIQTCPSTYHDRQPLGDNVLKYNTVTKATRHTTDSAVDMKTLENFAVTGSTVHSAADCR